MRKRFVLTLTIIIASCAVPVEAAPSDNSIISDFDEGAGKRFLRVESTLAASNGASTELLGGASTEGEGRAIKIPSALTGLVKNKDLAGVVKSLTQSNKNKMTPAKLRVKMLEKLPLDLQAKLIFAKMPTKAQTKSASKVATRPKRYPIKVPVVSSASARLELYYLLHYNVPPTVVFKKLGLRGHFGSRLHKHPFYKAYQWYTLKWIDQQII